ncbi:MAG: hypothetical protein JRI73_02865 [Deltaproteobacteria bacterium]|nr:hypothetical protein [Deltaproteobacteria bacterium]
MKLLHVLKSEPDEIIKTLMESLSEGNEVQQFDLYKGEVDYDKLVEQVFEHDKVICWW